MNSRIFLSAVLAATMLCGCARFSKSHFFEKAFGFDLHSYVESYEFSYEDGVLEVYYVSPGDELYEKIFNEDKGMHLDEMIFHQNNTQYYASQYVMIEDRSDEIIKFVLYLPGEKTMVFMYANGFGG